MKIPHEFNTKTAAVHSVVWLDENFAALVDKNNELEERIALQGESMKAMADAILTLNQKVAKLQPKAKK